jgi:nicotinamide mononucleotide (NMN) deamidase PncC
MVRGVQALFQSDCAISSTGIAGPGGATPDKPVGLCYLAALYHDNIAVKKFNFGKNRRFTKERGAAAGLELLRRIILNL